MIGASWSCEPLTLQLCEKWMSQSLSDCQSSSKRIGKGSAPHPPSMGQNVPVSGVMQLLLTRLPLRGSCELNIQPSSNSTASDFRCTAMAPPRTLILRLSCGRYILPLSAGRRCCAVQANPGSCPGDVARGPNLNDKIQRYPHSGRHP